MNTRSCAIVFAFTLFATAVCAEPLPPAADNRPDAGEAREGHALVPFD